jgi:hypothetical protein
MAVHLNPRHRTRRQHRSGTSASAQPASRPATGGSLPSATRRSDASFGHLAGGCGHEPDRAIGIPRQKPARLALDRVQALQGLIGAGSETIERLARGVTNALRETRAVLTLILQMGESTRRIEKIVDGLALVGQPASWSALRVPARRIVLRRSAHRHRANTRTPPAGACRPRWLQAATSHARSPVQTLSSMAPERETAAPHRRSIAGVASGPAGSTSASRPKMSLMTRAPLECWLMSPWKEASATGSISPYRPSRRRTASPTNPGLVTKSAPNEQRRFKR